MDRRSTNEIGYTHFVGDVTAQIGSSHGVRLTGGSTGGIIESVGDDTNVTLTIRAQGAGGIVVGNSSNGLASASPSTFTGVQFIVQGASSIVLSPTSTAGITIGNSSNQTPVMITASTMSIAGTSLACSAPALFTGANFKVQGASSIVLSPTSTAGITIGNSTNENPILITGSSVGVTSTHINLNSTRITMAGSTFGISFVQRQIVQIDSANMVCAAEGVNDTLVTVTGATSNSMCVFMPAATFSTRYTFQTYCSTANEVRIRLFNSQGSTFGSGESSNRGTLYVIG